MLEEMGPANLQYYPFNPTSETHHIKNRQEMKL